MASNSSKELLLSPSGSYFLLGLLQHPLISTEETKAQITGENTKYEIQRVKNSFQIKALSKKAVQ